MALCLFSLSGCLGPPSGSCGEPPCHDDLPAATAGDDLVPTWGVNETILFQDCTGMAATLTAAYDAVRRSVPDAFRIQGGTPATADVLLQAVQCGRIVAQAQIFANASFVKLAAFVAPANESWRVDGIHQFIIDAFVSDDALANLMGQNLAARAADVDRQAVPLTQEASLESWTLTGEGCTLGFEVRRSGQPSDDRTGTFHLWTGAGPFRRTEARQTYAYEPLLDPGATYVSGSCPGAQAIAVASPHVAQAYHSMQSAWLQAAEIPR